MTRPSTPPPTPARQRRGARRRARRAATLAAGLVLASMAAGLAQPAPGGDPAAPTAPTAPPPPRCGDLPGFGIVQRGALAPDGRLELAWTLFAAPRTEVRMRPLVFVDGRLTADLGPVDLACATPTARRVAGLAPRSAVHWLLHGWPPVPTELAALGYVEAVAAFAERQPPGVFAPADVGWHRVPGAPALAAGGARVRPGSRAGDALVEDQVAVRGAGFRPGGAGGRLVRAPVGERVPIRATYVAPDAADALLTCLLDGVQVDAFDGAPWRAVRLEPGALLVVDGSVPVPAPGWHRLHCLLLPDGAAPDPDEPPRPLLALYLWGDGP